MKTLLIVFIIAGMMSTLGIYATGFGSTPTTKTLAGSGDEVVSAPNVGTVTIGYATTGDTVTGILVTWTPSASGDYDLTVVAGGNTGTLNVPNSGTLERTDTVSIAVTETNAFNTTKLIISEN